MGTFIHSKRMRVTLHILPIFHQDPGAGLRPPSPGPTSSTYACLRSAELSEGQKRGEAVDFLQDVGAELQNAQFSLL